MLLGKTRYGLTHNYLENVFWEILSLHLCFENMLKASILNNDSQNALLNTAIKYEKGFIVNILPNRLQLQLSKGIRLPKLLHHIKSITITCRSH